MAWRFVSHSWTRMALPGTVACLALWQHNHRDENNKKQLICDNVNTNSNIGGLSVVANNTITTPLVVQAKETIKTNSKQQAKVVGKNFREQRFLDFASMEYNGIPYMTPQDFLESVTQDRPRYRKKRKVLTENEVDTMLHKTPSRWWNSNSKKLFRSINNNGIVSYSEYIFLVCVLAKPKSGFEIAFNMIDLAQNHRVDKYEFTILNRMISQGNEISSEQQVPGEVQDTSLMIYFFGKNGTDKLKYIDLSMFMDNIQTEVLEMEFTEFSKGLSTISETEFAKVLLRYTNLNEDQQSEYIARISTKVLREEGITFDDFKMFFQFLNSLEDFSLAMKMYTLARQPINQEEFQRAVKACVGYTLPTHLVSTVFLLFDKDDDGHLSYQEFLSILRDRIRGLSSKPLSHDTSWDSFKRCIKRTIKEAN